jgi:hypothetical protein
MFHDFMNFLRSDDTLAPEPETKQIENEFVYQAPERMEPRDVERMFARLFSTDDGRRVLSYLQAVTFQRALGPACADGHLRYTEGQRALVASILRLIDRGRRG